MSTKHSEGFTPFRGRRGADRMKAITLFIKQFLGVDTKSLMHKWIEIYSKIERFEGKLQAVRKTKDLYNYALRYSCGVQVDPLPFVRSNKKGVPLLLKEFLPYLNGTNDSRRAALTVLQLFKLIIVEPPYALTSITEPYRGQERPEWIDCFKSVINEVFPLHEQQTRISQLKTGFHISGSNGPNGPAVGNAFVDREVIRGTNLEQSVKRLSQLTNFEALSDLMRTTEGNVCEFSHIKGRVPSHSRIRIKYEPGGKARPFAICDFFSQSSLKSIHSFTMKWLRSIDEDSSKEHSMAAKTVKEWTSDKDSKIWSYDLTSATDRFPVFLQEIVLEQMFGSDIKDCWKDIILNRTFTGPKNEEVRFAVGQPLGALSSWSVFSITHHLILQTAANYGQQNFCWFKSYRMIGDDIVIHNNTRVAERYKSILESLSVDISINKSITPEQCSDGIVGEVAKRLFHNGFEVTPLPPAAIVEAFENPIGLRNLIENSCERGYLRASSPYPVQSLGLRKAQWASLTFPVRNRCPQLNGVTSLFRVGNFYDEFPAGLDPGWFIWETIPNEIIIKASRRFLFKKVNDAVKESLNIQQRVLLARYMKSEREDLPQGGDWQPGPFDCHPEILAEVFTELQDILMINQSRLWDDNLLLGDVVDLYAFIGQLHKYLEPRILLVGRSKVINEKAKTLIFMASIVKFTSSIVINNRESELDIEPEMDSFALADDLGFYDLDFE